MGFGGGLLLVTIQAALADRHGERRAVALAEANVAASIAYVVLIGVLSLTAALHAGVARRAAGLARGPRCSPGGATGALAIDAPPPSLDGAGSPARRVLGRGGDAVLHGGRRVVHHARGAPPSCRTPPACPPTPRSR